MHRPLVLSVLAILAAAGSARAGTLSWSDAVGTGATAWHRPLTLTAVDSGPAVPYHSLSFFVDQSGTYQIASRVASATSPAAASEAIYLYGESFDAEHPLVNLVAFADNGPNGSGVAAISAQLAAGVIYQVVTSLVAAGSGTATVAADVSGPGAPLFSDCVVADAHKDDADQALAMAGDRFCVSAVWQDGAGGSGIGLPVGHRSDGSGLFYFFSPDNWELSVKVIDGCAVNDRFWVFLSGSTDVGFTVTVRDVTGNTPTRRYTNAAHHLTSVVADTNAFPCTPGSP